MSALSGRLFVTALALAIAYQTSAGAPVSDIDIILEKIPGGIIFDVSGGVGADELCLELPKKASVSGVRESDWTFGTGEKGEVCARGLAEVSPFVVTFDIDQFGAKDKLDIRILEAGKVLYKRKRITPRLLPDIQPITEIGDVLAFPEEVEPGRFIQAKVLKPDLTPARGTWQFTGGLSGVVIEEAPEEESDSGGADEQPRSPVADENDPEKLVLWVPGEFGALSGTVVADEEAEGTDDGSFAAGKKGSDSSPKALGVINGTRSNLKRPKSEAQITTRDVLRPTKLSGAEDVAEDSEAESAAPGGSYNSSRSRRKRRTVVAEGTGDEAVRRPTPGGSEKGDSMSGGSEDTGEPGEVSSMDEISSVEAVGGAPLSQEEIQVRYRNQYGQLVVDGVIAVTIAPPSGGSDPTPAITSGTNKAFAGRKACVCGRFPEPRFWDALSFDGLPLSSILSASSRVVAFTLPGDVAPGPHTVVGLVEAGYAESDRWQINVLQLQGNIDQNKLRTGGSTSMSLRIFGSTDSLSLTLRNMTPGVISLEGGDQQVVTTSGGERNLLERNVRAVGPGDFDIQWELEQDWCPCAGP